MTTNELQDAMEMMGAIPPREIKTEVSGFIPIFEVLVEKYGNIVTPAVYGAVWRFCQMEDGVCRAALDTIGAAIGLDRATVMRHAKLLCDDEFLRDLTPDLRNRPHIYADTGKVMMKNQFAAYTARKAKGVAERKATVAQRNVTVAQCNTGVAESHMNKDFNKDSNKDIYTPAQIAALTVPEAMALPELQMFRDATGTFPGFGVWYTVYDRVRQNPDWTVDAMRDAYARWVGKGWNPRNLEWMNYVGKEIPARGRGPKYPNAVEQKKVSSASIMPNPTEVTREVERLRGKRRTNVSDL